MARGHERGIGDESSIAAIATRFGPGFRVTWHEPSYTSCLARLTRWLPAEETHAMTTKIFRIEGFILAATLVACGGGGGTKATVATFCDDKATAECDGVASRCLATDTACKAARVTACNAFVAAVQNPTTRPFQSDKITDCINKTKDVYKKATITPADRATMDAACQRVFSGVKVKNDPCVSDYECDTSLFCDISLAAPVCASKSTVASMDFCNNPGETCPTGQYCAAGASRMCMARATMGLACATVPRDPALHGRGHVRREGGPGRCVHRRLRLRNDRPLLRHVQRQHLRRRLHARPGYEGVRSGLRGDRHQRRRRWRGRRWLSRGCPESSIFRAASR